MFNEPMMLADGRTSERKKEFEMTGKLFPTVDRTKRCDYYLQRFVATLRYSGRWTRTGMKAAAKQTKTANNRERSTLTLSAFIRCRGIVVFPARSAWTVERCIKLIKTLSGCYCVTTLCCLGNCYYGRQYRAESNRTTKLQIDEWAGVCER